MNNEIKDILDFKEDSDYKRLSIDEILILRDYITNLLNQKNSIIEEIREYIMTELITEWDIKNNGHVSGSDLPAYAITPILDILDKVEAEQI